MSSPKKPSALVAKTKGKCKLHFKYLQVFSEIA